MISRTVAPLLAVNLLASALAAQRQGALEADPEEGAALRPRPVARHEDGISLGLTSQLGSETWDEDASDTPIPEGGAAGGEAEVSMPVSRRRGSEEGAALRRGLGLQLGSFVRQEGAAPKPRDPAAVGFLQKGPDPQKSPDDWQEGVAGQSEQQEGEGVVSIQLSPAVGEGIGLGPQLGSETWEEDAPEVPSREDGSAGGEAEVSMPMSEEDVVGVDRTVASREDGEVGDEAEVSMPMSEEDVVGLDRTLALGPKMIAHASVESVPVWYANMLESVSQHNGYFFQLVFLVNVLLASAFYCQPVESRRVRSKRSAAL